MQTNVLEYLEQTVLKVPEKLAFVDEKEQLTFRQLYDGSRAIGSYLIKKNIYKEPVLVFMKKSVRTIQAFLGIIYGGGLYVPVDADMPEVRIKLIMEKTKAKFILCDEANKARIQSLQFDGEAFVVTDLVHSRIDCDLIDNIKKQVVDTDPLYILFTSGSTGMPKGVIGHHRAVIDYTDHISEALGVGEHNIFGNQSPLHFDGCMKDIYPTLKYGATTYFIPKHLFSFPIDLIKYLNENKINSICWVASAFALVSSLGTLENIVPKYVHTVAFGSEVLPVKQFNIWRKTLKNARFINTYGPTETTGVSCYYEVDRFYEENETIPIGYPFKNTGVFLVKEDGKEAQIGEEGEIYIRGSGVTHGYYDNEEKTKEVFVQNPLNSHYQEIVYRTGDIGKFDEKGRLYFISRKDYQIKHMGYRIELGEIDSNLFQMDGVYDACSIYSKSDEKIVMYYTGTVTKSEVIKYLKEKVPRYMVPNIVLQLEQMPLLPNGKKNRSALEQMYMDYKKEKRR